MNSYLIGIDIGTESGRAVLFNLEGEVLTSVSSNYPVYYPKKGYAEQNPDDWWQATLSNLKKIINKAHLTGDQLAGIGICGQMHAAIPVNRDGDLLLERVPIWCDKRSRIEDFKNRDLQGITGNVVNSTWTGFKMRWFKKNYPEFYEKTYKFLSCKDYLNYKLTGQFYTDYSEASGTYLFDIKKNDWSELICKKMGIERSKLPEIHKSNYVIGKVGKPILKELGLTSSNKIKVVCGGGDMMCLLLGAGMVKEGIGCDVTGTAADVSSCVSEPLLDSRIMNLHHVVGDKWVPYGINDSGGGSMQWFKNQFGKEEEKIAVKKDTSVYEIFSKKAESVNVGSDGLLFLPYLMGERTLGGAESRGVFFGLDSTHKKAHLIRAIMEGVTYDLKQSLDIIKKEIKVSELRAIGGGANSKVWLNIKANIYNIPVVTLQNFEGGAIGAAILAGVGAGIFNNEKEAANKMINISEHIFPREDRVKMYENYYKLFKTLHDEFQQYYRQLDSMVNKN